MPEHTPCARDWQAAADIIATVATADSPESAGESALEPMRTLFDAEVVLWDRFARDGTPLAFRGPPEIVAAHSGLRPVFAKYFPEHPFAKDLSTVLATRGVFLLSDRITNRVFRETGLWNEVYVHLRARNQMTLGGTIDAASTWGIGLNRLGRDFGGRERELGRFLQPRLNRVFQRLARAQRDHATSALLARLLSSRDIAHATWDAHNQLTNVSKSAQDLVGPLFSGDLPASAAAARSDLVALLGSARSSSDGTPAAATFGQTAGRNAVLLQTPAGEKLIVWESPAPKAAAAGGARPLSPRESEVFDWLKRGKSNADIACILGISARTVERHCANIFAKLGVENRLAAALTAKINS